MSIVFNWYGGEIPLGILSVVHTYLNLRVYFTAPVVNNAALRDPDTYQIEVDQPTVAYDFGGISVTPEDTLYPTYVDIEVTDCTGGEDYMLVIEPDVIVGQDSKLLGSGFNTAEFVGVTEDPVVLAAVPTSLRTVRVIFSKSMTQNQDLYNPASYVWTGGLMTLDVEEETNSTVILTTSEQTPSAIYDLTVG
jgi:hypothetical protein